MDFFFAKLFNSKIHDKRDVTIREHYTILFCHHFGHLLCSLGMILNYPKLFFSSTGVTQNDIIEARLFDRLPVAYSPKWLKEHPEAAAPPVAS